MSSFILKYKNGFDIHERYIAYRKHHEGKFHYKVVTGRWKATVFNDSRHADNAIREFCNGRAVIQTIYVTVIEDVVEELCTI